MKTNTNPATHRAAREEKNPDKEEKKRRRKEREGIGQGGESRAVAILVGAGRRRSRCGGKKGSSIMVRRNRGTKKRARWDEPMRQARRAAWL